MAAAAPPLDDDDLLRFSPLASSLLHASMVSKRWERLAATRDFRRRFVAHHRKPPILGVFEKYGRELVFTSVLDPPDRIPRGRFSLCLGGEKYDAFNSWTLLGCRHGRVLILSSCRPRLLVFDPISGDRHHVAVPRDFGNYGVSGAVLCAAGNDQDHVHGDCQSSPFKVVLVRTRSHGEPAIARVYSSQTGMWGHLVSAEPCAGMISALPCTLVDNALYWWLNESRDEILEFDLDSQRLAVVKRPTFAGIDSTCIRIIRAEGGGVGIAVLSLPGFQMWGRKVSSDGASAWVLQKTINMPNIIGLPYGAAVATAHEAIVGYSEDADAVFISISSNTEHYTFIVQLEPMQSRKINPSFLEHSYHPFTNFYTAGAVMA